MPFLPLYHLRYASHSRLPPPLSLMPLLRRYADDALRRRRFRAITHYPTVRRYTEL